MDQLGPREFLFFFALIAWLFIAQALVSLAVKRFEQSMNSQKDAQRKKDEQAQERKKVAFHFGGKPAL